MAKFKVLLIDDEPDFLEVMSRRIGSWGYDVIKAAGGAEALGALGSKKPDIIILDYMMPDMDGVATLKNIRKVNPAVPVIMFTAYPDDKSFEGSEKLNVSVFLPKISIYSDTQAALQESLKLLEKKVKRK